MSYKEYISYYKLLSRIWAAGVEGIWVTQEIRENLFFNGLGYHYELQCYCPPVFDLHVQHILHFFIRGGQTFVKFLAACYSESSLPASKLLKSQGRKDWIQYMPHLGHGIITLRWHISCCVKDPAVLVSYGMPKEGPIVLFSSNRKAQVWSNSVLYWIEIQQRNPNAFLPGIIYSNPSFIKKSPHPHTHLDVCSLCGRIDFLISGWLDGSVKVVTYTSPGEQVNWGIGNKEYLPENIAVGIREHMQSVTKPFKQYDRTKHGYLDVTTPPIPFENYRLIANLQLSRLRQFST